MAELLVTGGAGFIGANFVHYWLATHSADRVTVLDALTYAGNRASLGGGGDDERLHFVHGDIRDDRLVASLIRDRRIPTIVHFAAESHVDRSISGPDVFLDTNVLGTHSLLKAARQVWLEEGAVEPPLRFHHVSTDEVYGSLGPDDAPFTELTPLAPNSPYAASKAASDHLVRAYHHTFGLPTTTTNCSNNYGPYHFPEKLIPLMIVNALEGKPLPLYGDGLNVRDWLYVEDHCRAIDAVLERGAIGETYNVGGENECANVEVVRLVCRLIEENFSRDPSLAGRFPACPAAGGGRVDALITPVRDRPGHDRRYAIDPSRIRREVGFRPTETFSSGLARTVRWYLDNETWWRGVMDGSYRHWMESHYGNAAVSSER